MAAKKMQWYSPVLWCAITFGVITYIRRYATPRRMLDKLLILRFYRKAVLQSPWHAVAYLLVGKEITNFTYDLKNEDQIGTFLGAALGVDPDMAYRYVRELEDDGELRSALNTRLRRRNDRNSVAHYGRRAGWYALVRLLKPKLVVETGIHDGLGSAILLRALQRNADEGQQGQLLSFDIDPHCGWLVPTTVAARWHPVIEDTKQSLNQHLKSHQVDVFIHDSDHSLEHERFEFETVIRHMAPNGVLISDNSHASSVLANLAAEWGFSYSLFLEEPKRHFYPGAGIGLAVPGAMSLENPQKGLGPASALDARR